MSNSWTFVNLDKAIRFKVGGIKDQIDFYGLIMPLIRLELFVFSGKCNFYVPSLRRSIIIEYVLQSIWIGPVHSPIILNPLFHVIMNFELFFDIYNKQNDIKFGFPSSFWLETSLLLPYY